MIPADMRKALNMKAGDRITVKLEGQSLVLQRATRPAAKLKRGRFGRPVLTASSGAPAMTTERVNALLEELP